jgi:hypothetical protein
MGLDETESLDYFSDGRRVGFLLEMLVVKQLGMTKATTERSPFDATDRNGKTYEIRCLTTDAFFAPNNQRGKGRRFDERGFLNKLDVVDNYLFVDIDPIHVVTGVLPVYQLSSSLVRMWYSNGVLGKSGGLGRSKFLTLVGDIPPPVTNVLP